MTDDKPHTPARNAKHKAQARAGYDAGDGSNEDESFIQLTDQQRLDWLQLIRSENVGPTTFHDLLRHFGSASRALNALPELSRKGGARRAIAVATKQETESEWEQIYHGGARLVALGEEDYPV